jgi:hypothetical protein
VTSPSDGHAVESALTDLVRDYDKRWSSLDFVALGDLWERDDPAPIYVGDEYAAPLIGNDELERHWARVAGRLKSATVSSTLHEFDVVDDTVVRAIVLSRWRLAGMSVISAWLVTLSVTQHAEITSRCGARPPVGPRGRGRVGRV